MPLHKDNGGRFLKRPYGMRCHCRATLIGFPLRTRWKAKGKKGVAIL